MNAKEEDDLKPTSIRLNVWITDLLNEVARFEKRSPAEVHRNALSDWLLARKERHLRVHVAGVKAFEKELTDAERAQEIEAKKLRLKKEKLEAQKLENVRNPHLAG